MFDLNAAPGFGTGRKPIRRLGFGWGWPYLVRGPHHRDGRGRVSLLSLVDGFGASKPSQYLASTSAAQLHAARSAARRHADLRGVEEFVDGVIAQCGRPEWGM